MPLPKTKAFQKQMVWSLGALTASVSVSVSLVLLKQLQPSPSMEDSLTGTYDLTPRDMWCYQLAQPPSDVNQIRDPMLDTHRTPTNI